jgi:carboxylesterase
VVLAAPIYIDGWATPWYRGLRPLLYGVPGLRQRMKIEEEDPFGIKNEQLRAIVKAKFERGENFHYRWVPLECLRQVDRLRAIVMKAAKKIPCPTLVVHAREDELTSLRSANFLVEAIGGGRARMVVLEDSYHMVCVDNDKEIVAKNVLEFFGAALPGATSVLANEPRMSADELHTAVDGLLAHLGTGDFNAVRTLGIPDFSWVQPGNNKVAGAHVGKAFASFAGRLPELGAPRFTAFGTRVWNRGVALVPATLTASRDGTTLESQGSLLCAWHAGKLLELRWFADESSARMRSSDRPIAAAGPCARAGIRGGDRRVAALRKAPDNDALLALYSLYKRSEQRRCHRRSPGRSTWWDAPSTTRGRSARGVGRDDAMRQTRRAGRRPEGSGAGGVG